MKKTTAIIIVVILVLTGCSTKKEEKIKSFIMSYNTSVEKNSGDYNMLYVFFENDENYITYRNHTEKVDYKYKITDVETLTAYINSIKTKADKRNVRAYSEGLQTILWSIYFETEENEYSFSGADDYPGYWEEMWQVLLDVSDAESLEDFGFKNTVENEGRTYE